MPVKVIIPTPLRHYTGKKDSIEVEARTVAEALSSLTAQYDDLRRHLYNDEGKLRSFVNIYLNDEDIRYLQKEATPLAANDVISIVPSIAGGREFVSGPSSGVLSSSPPVLADWLLIRSHGCKGGMKLTFQNATARRHLKRERNNGNTN